VRGLALLPDLQVSRKSALGPFYRKLITEEIGAALSQVADVAETESENVFGSDSISFI